MQAKSANRAADAAKPTRIMFMAYEDVTLLDLSGPMQVFEVANSVHARRMGSRPYDLSVRTLAQGATKSDVGLVIQASPLDVRERFDFVFVPGGRHSAFDEIKDRVRSYLREQDLSQTEVASVCVGAFLLGHSGLLDGRKVVTHWKYCDALQAEFPEAIVSRDSIFVHDEIWTSAGVTAGIDLALAIVERDLGHAVAVEVAQAIVVYLKRAGGQSQYSTILALQAGVCDSRLAELHGWIADNVRRRITVETLARRMNMSLRTFSRFYVDAAGLTPKKGLEKIRLDMAHRMTVDHPNLTLKKVADRCGFTDEEHMRRSFIRHFDLTPSEIRRRFSSLQEETQ